MIFLECIGSRASLSATEDKGVNESLRLFVFIVRTGLPGMRGKTKRGYGGAAFVRMLHGGRRQAREKRS